MSYLEITGSLLYVTQTRPDIQFTVSIISQFGGNPGRPHLESAKHVLCYLQGIAHLTLTLGQRKHESVDLIGWTDSNWAQDLDSRRLVGGFIFDIAGSTISWSSKKQPTVTLSIVEAKYMAASNTTKEAIWLRTLLEDLGHPPVAATILHANNQGCIAWLGTQSLTCVLNTLTSITISFVNALTKAKLTYNTATPRTCWWTFSLSSCPETLLKDSVKWQNTTWSWSGEPELNGKGLASTYVLRPPTIALSQILE